MLLPKLLYSCHCILRLPKRLPHFGMFAAAAAQQQMELIFSFSLNLSAARLRLV